MKQDVREHFHENSITRCCVAKKGIIGPERSPEDLLWQRVDGEVYLTCAFCGAVNRITSILEDICGNPTVHWAGNVSYCATCVHCKGHNMVILEGWDGPAFRHCWACNRVVFGLAQELDWPEGTCPRCHLR